MTETTENVVVEEETTKKYELRNLEAGDVFLMSRIIKKIGVANFQKCFNNEAVQKAISSLSDDEKANDNGKTTIGYAVAFEIADVIFARLPECETEVYEFLSALSSLKVNEIKKLPFSDFFEMIIEVIRKKEFKDFIKVVSKLFK